MCILIVKPANKPLPSIHHLLNCWHNNPDGCGYAVPGKKPFHSLDFFAFYNALSKEDPDKPMIIHFRWATHGSVKKSNCHPFWHRPTGVAFAHNGVLGIEPWGDLTDSETAFRKLFVPAIRQDAGLSGCNLSEAVRRVIGGSKFAFLGPKGELRVFGRFINDDGVLYSNNSYLYSRRLAVAR